MIIALDRIIDAATTSMGTSESATGVTPHGEFEAPNSTTYVVRRRLNSVSNLVSAGTGYGTVTDSSERNFALSLHRIKRNSGLSWGEVARVLGVSRRTVYNWLASTKVSGVNAQRVAGMYRAITQELANVPRSAAREFLLAPGPHGVRLDAIARDLRARYPHKQPAMSGFDKLRAASLSADPMITGGLDESVEVVHAEDPWL